VTGFLIYLRRTPLRSFSAGAAKAVKTETASHREF